MFDCLFVRLFSACFTACLWYVCEVVSLTCLTACLGYVCEVVFNVFDCLFVRLFSACLTAGLGYAEAAGGNNCQRTGAELT